MKQSPIEPPKKKLKQGLFHIVVRCYRSVIIICVSEAVIVGLASLTVGLKLS